MFAFSNISTLMWVMFSIGTFSKWIHPHLNKPLRIYFYFLLAWTPMYIVGQFAQECKWGSIWVQYQLLDLCYMQWGMVLLIGFWTCWRKLRRMQLNGVVIAAWLPTAFALTMSFGFASEVWDTFWTWIGGTPLNLSFDIGDYTCLAIGAVILTMPFYAMRIAIPHRLALQVG